MNARSSLGMPIHRWLDHEEIARMLLEYGADPNALDYAGWTPLCLCRSIEVARLLIEYGADPDVEIHDPNNKDGKKLTPRILNEYYVNEASECNG